MPAGNFPGSNTVWDMNPADPVAPITRLVGVYDANGSLSGEIAYWVGARLGMKHCALCDITHGLVRPKQEWNRQVESLGVEFKAVHLDEREPVVEDASRGREPCVVAIREDGSADVVVDRHQLESCDGNPASLAELLGRILGSSSDS